MKYSIALILILLVSGANAQKLIFKDSIVLNLKSGAAVTATVCLNNADTTPLPAILIYSIYASPQINRTYSAIAASKGYVGVVVNTRGKSLSKDGIEPFEHDAEDAYEVIDCSGALVQAMDFSPRL